MKKILAPITLSLILMASAASAAEQGCGDTAPALTLKEANALLQDVGEVKSIEASPVNGLWLLELERDGRHGKAFLDFDKKNLIVGTVFPLASTKVAAKQPTLAAPTRADVATIPVADSLVMGNPKGSQKLFVFSDPECPFCAKMHGELKKLISLEPDLAVYVKVFPLPIHPQAYTKARVILGSGSLDLLEKAFNGEALPPLGPNDSRKPVMETLTLARSLGISATPTLVLPDGEIVTGSMDSTSLQNLLSQHRKH